MTQLSLRSAMHGPAGESGRESRDRRARIRTRKGPLQIAGAAIRYSDLGVRALPLPASHDDIRALVAQLHGSRCGKHKGEVGFITNRGGFVKAKEALVIARYAGQLGPTRIRSDELCLEYLKRASAPAWEQGAGPPRPAGIGRFARWGFSRRAAGELVTRQNLRRQFFHTSLAAMGLLLLVWLLSKGLPQWAGGLSAGAPWQGLAAQAAVYLVMGLAVAHVIHARGARFRRPAVAAFVMLVALSLAWPLAMRPDAGFASFVLMGTTIVTAAVTVTLFAYIRLGGALLLALAFGLIAYDGYGAYAPAAMDRTAVALSL